MRSLFALMLLCTALGFAGCGGNETDTTAPPAGTEPTTDAPADDTMEPAGDEANEGP